MAPLLEITPFSTGAADEVPFEFEFRVDGRHLELWRWVEKFGDVQHCQFQRRYRLKMRRKGAKFPVRDGLFLKRPYRFVWKKVKALWKEQGRPKHWVCRFDAFAVVESGVLAQEGQS